jgi:hypothetical protein
MFVSIYIPKQEDQLRRVDGDTCERLESALLARCDAARRRSARRKESRYSAQRAWPSLHAPNPTFADPYQGISTPINKDCCL